MEVGKKRRERRARAGAKRRGRGRCGLRQSSLHRRVAGARISSSGKE